MSNESCEPNDMKVERKHSCCPRICACVTLEPPGSQFCIVTGMPIRMYSGLGHRYTQSHSKVIDALNQMKIQYSDDASRGRSMY